MESSAKYWWQKHCPISTTGCIVNTFLSHSHPKPCIIPSHNHPITARSLSIWRVRQVFKWENVAWYWITALFLHMYKFFTVNLSFLCLSVWEDKFRHLHLENSSLLPRQLNLRCNRLFPKGILKSRVSVCQESAISHFTDYRMRHHFCQYNKTSSWARVYPYPSLKSEPHIQTCFLTSSRC